MKNIRTLVAEKANRNSYYNSIGVGKYQAMGTSALTVDETNAAVRQAQEEKEAFAAALGNGEATRENAQAWLASYRANADEAVATAKSKAKSNASKVCTIANRLSNQGMSRSEAFRKAWATVKAETVETKVAGVTAGRRQEALERLTRYETNRISVSLSRESDNNYDSNAVAVIVSVEGKGSYTMGYLPRMLAATIAPLIDAGKAVKANFKEIRGKYHNYHNYGMAVSVSI